jgi:hypothetical protein
MAGKALYFRPDRGMTTARVVEAIDEFEHRDPCLGLRLEPAPIEKLAFQRGRLS